MPFQLHRCPCRQSLSPACMTATFGSPGSFSHLRALSKRVIRSVGAGRCGPGKPAETTLHSEERGLHRRDSQKIADETTRGPMSIHALLLVMTACIKLSRSF